MIGHVSALLVGHLAAGGLFVTAMLSLGNKLPAAFVRFCVASAAGAALFAAAVDTPPLRPAWLSVALMGGLWYALLRFRSPGPIFTVLTGAVALGAPVGFAVRAADSGAGLLAAGSATSSLLLGAVTITMILGHWYLVDTSLSITPLRAGARWVWIAVLLRLGAVGLVLAYGGFEVLRVHRLADIIFSTTGLFFFFRSVMGLAAPLLLAGLIWQTVKIRSTQSATGLLYVALILVLFGELVSQFLLVTTGYPL